MKIVSFFFSIAILLDRNIISSSFWFKQRETSPATETQTTTSTNVNDEVQTDTDDNPEDENDVDNESDADDDANEKEFLEIINDWQEKMTRLENDKDSIYDNVISAEMMRVDNEEIAFTADKSQTTGGSNIDDTREKIEKFKSTGILSILDVYATKYKEHRNVMFMAQNCLKITESVKATALAPFNLLLLSISFGLKQSKIQNVLQTIGTGTVSTAKKHISDDSLNTISSFVNLIGSFRQFSPTLSLIIDAAKAFLWTFTPSPPSSLRPILWAKSLVFSVNSCFKMLTEILFNYKFYQLYFDSLKAVSTNPIELSASYKEKSVTVDTPATVDKTENDEKMGEIIEEITEMEIAETELDKVEKKEMENLDDSLKKRIHKAMFLQHLIELTKMTAGFTLFWSFICLLTWLRI